MSGSSGDAGWRLTLFVDAAEASGSFRYSRSRPPTVRVPGGAGSERAGPEAARRARQQVRRYCAANRLDRMGTLTYAPPFCTDPRQLRRDVGKFFRRLRSGLGGGPMPYLWVPELHADGARFHVHFGVSQYIHKTLIEEAWGHGFVDIGAKGRRPGSSGIEGARRAARYLSKYVGKSIGAGSMGGLHRYEVAQGFQPVPTLITGRSREETLATASKRMGRPPDRLWTSDESQDWQGAPSVWASWDR